MDDDLIDVSCPRCGAATRQRFYGPCPACVGQLRSEQTGVADVRVDTEYVPKMNVTPNQIASKD